jgi:hypothetical protein
MAARTLEASIEANLGALLMKNIAASTRIGELKDALDAAGAEVARLTARVEELERAQAGAPTDA